MAGKPQMHLRSAELLRLLMCGEAAGSVAEFARRAALTRQCIDGLLKRGTCRRTTADAVASAVGLHTLDLFDVKASNRGDKPNA
ncbi:hypothetical protein [Sphaerisporangium rhizosphaerae]|uniref:XRE family transcriptional regulator n=1 Tax=Sphaerisporangium rhizosphaerae TaxID=2269375 RepID=A0ABW2PFN3_9ACTN